MSDVITGPDKDGLYWYRAWRLVRWEDCNEGVRAAGFTMCLLHKTGKPMWVALPAFEGTAADFRRIASEAGFTHLAPSHPSLGRHVGGDVYLSYPTIESAIDAWEAARERLFREAFAQAMSEP